MEFTLSLTHRCNLSCTYCYSGRAVKKDMSFATAQKIVDFAMDITPPGRKIEFGFFGGEPLLCFGLVKETTSYIREKQKERPVRLSITTNGTLLTQSILDFLKREKVDLCISIDGPAHVHDLNRCYKDGRGSFADVARNLQEAIERLDYVQVNAVYGPDTIDFLPESVSFFTQLGVQVIHLNPDICASWTKDAYPKLRETYMQIANHYVQSYQHGQEIAVNLIDSKNILFLKGGYAAGDMCGMGETEWGFAPSGNIYPCERFIGEDSDPSLCLGNIHTGLDLTRRCSLLKRRGNSNRECKTCEYKRYCMNWCGCTNHFMTGHTDLAGSMLCASEKEIIKAAKHVFVTLSQTDNELFIDHLMKYLHEGHHYQQP
jgi:uncharacterized protein